MDKKKYCKQFDESIVEESARRKAALLEVHDPLGRAEDGLTESERLRADFEYWAARCVRIRHKLTGRMVPFVLNRAQRHALAVMESMRREGKPVRLIVLKSRQWGCSTLMLLYMAWIQMTQEENWHSLICAHVKDAAASIRGLYSSLVGGYPEDLLPEGVKIQPYEGARSIRVITGRECRVTVCSAEKPDGARGADYSMALLSEVAFWPDTVSNSPEDVVRAVCGSVARVANSVVVMESTANGPGNYFHREWRRACGGECDKKALFIPWHEIEMNVEELGCGAREFWESMSEYEQGLWEAGLCLEQISWYRNKRREYQTDQQMMAEYPTVAAEAFCNSMAPVFEPAQVEAQRALVCEHLAELGYDRGSGRLGEMAGGGIRIWAHPVERRLCGRNRGYIMSVDIGGRWEGSDWSVIAVFDCRDADRMELVAQWRGHTDVDLLCEMAAALGEYYNDAMMVVESNSLEQRGQDALERIAAGGYPNIYRRQALDSATGAMEERYGFHTNVATKNAALTDLAALMRDGVLRDHCGAAVEEMATYVRYSGDKAAAAPGCHDDMVMTRAIAAYAMRQSGRTRPRKPFRAFSWL